MPLWRMGIDGVSEFLQVMFIEHAARGHSRSLEMTPFDRSHITSYSRFIVTLALACTVSEI